MRSWIKIVIFMVYTIICGILTVKIFVANDFKTSSSNISISSYLYNISDSRIRISKLIGRSVLGPISMWMAFPTSDQVLPGANWYDQVWDKYDFAGFKLIDEIISLSPCQNYDKIFLQIGAHLGVFPLIAAYRGCQGIAVEPIPVATNFARLSGILNNWSENQFSVINAVGSNQNGGFTWFDPKGITLSSDNETTFGKVRIPFITIDAINNKYGYGKGQKQSRIVFVMIDVEGYEQEVLLGSKQLIEKKTVLVFQIELWTQRPHQGIVKSYSGLQLLVDNGYQLYALIRNTQMNFQTCDSLTNRLSQLPQLFNQSCQQSTLPKDRCLGEIFALRQDIPPLKQWFSDCPQ